MIFILLACTPKTVQKTQKSKPDTELVYRSNHVDTVHGVDVFDPYQWMTDSEELRLRGVELTVEELVSLLMTFLLFTPSCQKQRSVQEVR